MKKNRKLKEILAIMANIIYKEQEIDESNLIERLEDHYGVSFWTYDKIKKFLLIRYEDIKFNGRLRCYYVGHLDSSLSTLSLSEKQEMK